MYILMPSIKMSYKLMGIIWAHMGSIVCIYSVKPIHHIVPV